MADNWQLKAIISANAAGLIKTLDSVNKATRATRKHIADIGSGSVKLAQSLALPVGLMSGLAAGFSVAGVVAAAKNFALLGDEVAKGSQRIGVSIADFQQLNYVAGQSGVSVDELQSSVGRLNKGIAMAAAGKNKDLASLFAKAGISMRDANGQLRSGADLLPEVADLFARNGNAAVRARMGNTIYGKSWQTLAPLLLSGSEGIKQLQDRYKQLGLEVDASAIKAGEAFGDQLDDLQQVTKSYGNTIMSRLVPVMAPLLEKTIQWAVANREVITTRITAFVGDLAQALERVNWQAVIDGVSGFFNGLKSLVDWLGGARNALIALVVFMNASSIAAFVSLTGSVFKLGGSLWTLAVTQIPASIAAMGGLQAAAGAAAFKLGTMLGLMAKVGALAGAGWAGWEVGKLLNDYVINPTVQVLTGKKDASLGTAIYDLFNADPNAPQPGPVARASANNGFAPTATQRPSLLAPQSKGRVDGQVTVKFDNMPPGARVDQLGTGTMPINLDVGYHSFATGMPS